MADVTPRARSAHGQPKFHDKRVSMDRDGVRWRGWILLATMLAGCNRTEQVEHYTVLKPPPIERTAVEPSAPPASGEAQDRTLAAIVPLASQGWFFKLTGPKDAVAAHEADFSEFLKSVHFDDQGKPAWDLPAGWQQRPGSDIRFATLLCGADAAGKALEVSVTVLPKSGDDDDYALLNINRWRGQLKLPPIDREQLASESTTLELAGAKARVVNLLGTASASGMRGGPFFPGAGDGK
jgi:hypothetical protein